MSGTDYAARVDQHWGTSDLGDRVLDMLRASGKDIDALTADDLPPVDQLHTGGKDVTLELARRAAIDASMHVLDVGGGVGGPARTLAAHIGCQVTVLDVTRDYCEAGALLTARTGLNRLVRFRQGDALDMPFDDAAYDAVLTQQATMNIPDKRRLYAEIHRVLRPGGRLVFQEIMAGPVTPLHFPTAWALEPSISFLIPAEETRGLLAGIGFSELWWADVSGWWRDAARERVAALADPSAQPLPSSAAVVAGIAQLVLGDRLAETQRKNLQNLEEGRVVMVQALFERP